MADNGLTGHDRPAPRSRGTLSKERTNMRHKFDQINAISSAPARKTFAIPEQGQRLLERLQLRPPSFGSVIPTKDLNQALSKYPLNERLLMKAILSEMGLIR
jgi:hypothetical protein